jgi:hypothetical protein
MVPDCGARLCLFPCCRCVRTDIVTWPAGRYTLLDQVLASDCNLGYQELGNVEVLKVGGSLWMVQPILYYSQPVSTRTRHVLAAGTGEGNGHPQRRIRVCTVYTPLLALLRQQCRAALSHRLRVFKCTTWLTWRLYSAPTRGPTSRWNCSGTRYARVSACACAFATWNCCISAAQALTDTAVTDHQFRLLQEIAHVVWTAIVYCIGGLLSLVHLQTVVLQVGGFTCKLDGTYLRVL